jgi:hypothetical protein
VAEEVGKFTNYSAVGFIDADQGSADICHNALNHAIAGLLPVIYRRVDSAFSISGFRNPASVLAKVLVR